MGNGGVRATRCALTLKARSNAYRRMADPQFPFQGNRATIATQGSATVTPRPVVRIAPAFVSITLAPADLTSRALMSSVNADRD
jgi:hypothetical protein